MALEVSVETRVDTSACEGQWATEYTLEAAIVANDRSQETGGQAVHGTHSP